MKERYITNYQKISQPIFAITPMKFLMSLFCVFFSATLYAQHDILGEIISYEKQLNELDKKRENISENLENLRLRRNIDYIYQYGVPRMENDSGQTHRRNAFVFNYNIQAKQSNWVAHIIGTEIANGIITRTNDFREDSLLDGSSSTKADYWDSGFDRGHLAPSADFRWSLKALSESYLYSNMSPQRPELNRERWAQLEDLLRTYVLENKRPLYVVTGPVWESGLDSIGPSRMAVPKRFYKVALDFLADTPVAVGFVMPNTYCKYPVIHYAISVDSVQRLTGIDFFPKLEIGKQHRAEQSFREYVWQPERKKGDVSPLWAEDLPAGTVNSVDAKNMSGKTATVCGTVVATKFNEKSGATFLNFDQQFPDQLFYASIWKSDLSNFPYQPHIDLLHKKVCVTGSVGLNRDIPNINIKNEKALRFLQD